MVGHEGLVLSNGKGLSFLLIFFLLVAVVLPALPISAYDEEEQQDDRVLGMLPGQSFNVSFAHYSGYIQVDEDSGRALFYWFFEAAEDPDSKPLVLWLNGGPGCSSIAYGLAEELGPFHINADGKSIYLNPYSWNQAANIIFPDSPVGVGFSYSNTSTDLTSNGDKRTAKDSLKFLKKWFKRYPQYSGRDFYLAGESYAGHYVPQLAYKIVEYSKLTGHTSINLKGYMVGNALTDDYHDHFGVFQFMWSSGLISDESYKLLNIFCDYQSFVHTSPLCEKVLEISDRELGTIDPYSIFDSSCAANTILARSKIWKRWHSVGKIGEKYDPCTESHSTVYFNLPEVQKALHVNPSFAPSKWETCSDVVGDNWKDCPKSMLNVIRKLIKAGLRIWMFSGDTDAVIPVTSTRYSIDALHLPTLSSWRPWYIGDRVGGWTQDYEGLTFVTVRGAGHEVPLHKPKESLVLFKTFLDGASMPTQSNPLAADS